MSQQIKKGRSLPTTPVVFASPSQAAHTLLEGRSLICLIRHGQTDWNLQKRLQGREDVPLNETGRLQSAAVADFFAQAKAKGMSVGAVCSSPLSRAKDTADCIAERLGVKSVVCERLNERDYGNISGMTVEERRKAFPRGENPQNNMESVPAAASRMLRAFDDILEISEGRTVVAVSHGGIINSVFSKLSFGEIGTGKTLTQNCSVSFIASGIGHPIPLAYNMQDDAIVDYIAKMLHFGADI